MTLAASAVLAMAGGLRRVAARQASVPFRQDAD
jgi:hypothetical protein